VTAFGSVLNGTTMQNKVVQESIRESSMAFNISIANSITTQSFINLDKVKVAVSSDMENVRLVESILLLLSKKHFKVLMN
jgi:hypothetical protein